MDVEGNDVFIGTSKGLAWGIGEGYYAGHEAAGRATRTASPRRRRTARAAQPAKQAGAKGKPGGRAAGHAAPPRRAGGSRCAARQSLVSRHWPLALSGLAVRAADRGRRRRPRRPPSTRAPTEHPLRRPEARRAAEEDRRGRRLRARPPMNLRKDENYAGTSEDLEPFAGATPYNENFLLQIEYAGAGRAKPEPEKLDTRQGRLHRADPRRPSRSPPAARATRRRSASRCCSGSRLAIEEWNARGG